MSHPHLKEVVRYYEETDWDHRNVWHKGMFQAAHFGIYDEHARDHQSALMNTTRIMAKLAGVEEGVAVMDAGCGWGGTCLWLSNYLGAKMTGVNIAAYQIEECRAKAQKLGVADRCQFVLSDYCHTSFKDGSFDVVWSCESLCHAPEKSGLYKEAYRVLKPGGRLVIADYLRNARPSKNEDLLHRWLDGWASTDIDTKEEHQANAQKARFSSFTTYDYSRQVKVSLHNLYVHAKRWRWIGVLGDKVGFLKPFRLQNVDGTIAMYEAFLQDLWQYHLIICEK